MSTLTSCQTLTDLLFEKAEVGLCLVAPDGTVVRVNAEWLRSTGFVEDQVVGENVIDLFPATRDMSLALHARARAGHRVEVPRHVQTLNGIESWWEGTIDPLPLDGGVGLLITAREVSGAMTRSARPRSGEPEAAPGPAPLPKAAELQAVLDAVPVAVFITRDREGRLLKPNRFAAEMLHVPTDSEIAGGRRGGRAPRCFRPLRHGKEIAPQDLPVQTAARGTQVHDYEFELAFDDGEVRHLVGNAEPLHDPGGEVVGAVGAFLDITDRKRAEEALAERERELRLAQRIAHVGSWAWTVGTRRLEASEEVARIYGRDPAAPIPPNDSEELRRHYTPEGWAHREAAFRRALADGQPWDCEEQILRPDGSVRWVQFRGEAQRDDTGRIVKLRGTVQDITEWRQVQDALRDSEQRFRALTDAMPQIVCALRPDGTPEYVNASWIAYSGLDLEATAREGWLGVLHPDDVPAARDCIRRGLERRTPQNVELRYRAADGTYRWFLSRLAPILDGARVVRFIGAGMDIDDRRRSEGDREQLLSRIQDADRRKDEFLAVLSHELRNPLAPIRNSAYVLRHAEAGTERARRALEIIERQTDHLTRLVDDLLDVTRIARGKIELRRARADLRELVRRAADDYQETMRERGIAFRAVLPSAETWADVDVTRIAQVVGNLLHNAAKFTRRGDEVTVALRTADGEAEISVRDTGIGIEPSLLPHVFDAFVQSDRTLARAEGGLGLGLALVKGIAELHGGTVRAGSAGAGRGAEFVVRLPVIAPYAGGRARERPPPPRAGQTRRVLVVDDDADAAESLARIVEMMGHVAEVAHDGPGALERARAFRPDVILCDIGLPGISGYEVARTIRAEHDASVQLVAITGYAQPDDVTKALDAGFDAHLAKPCDPERIARLLG